MIGKHWMDEAVRDQQIIAGLAAMGKQIRGEFVTYREIGDICEMQSCFHDRSYVPVVDWWEVCR